MMSWLWWVYQWFVPLVKNHNDLGSMELAVLYHLGMFWMLMDKKYFLHRGSFKLIQKLLRGFCIKKLNIITYI